MFEKAQIVGLFWHAWLVKLRRDKVSIFKPVEPLNFFVRFKRSFEKLQQKLLRVLTINPFNFFWLSSSILIIDHFTNQAYYQFSVISMKKGQNETLYYVMLLFSSSQWYFVVFCSFIITMELCSILPFLRSPHRSHYPAEKKFNGLNWRWI
jgi:hypothetical protein